MLTIRERFGKIGSVVGGGHMKGKKERSGGRGRRAKEQEEQDKRTRSQSKIEH
jgi:hypothetical protein